jgi:DNA repair exonuclease SbcCD nuclease subunit
MSAKPMLVLSSDLHLGQVPWVRYPEISGDAECALEQIESYCRKNKLDHFSAGDVFDNPYPSPEAVDFILEHASHLDAVDRKFHFIAGDHEVRSDGSYLTLRGSVGVVHLDRLPFPLPNQATLLGMDHRKGEELQSILDNIATRPPGDILFCHQSWYELHGDQGRVDGHLRDLPFKHVWTGHQHNHQVAHPRAGQTILSPGATHIRDAAEPTEHFFFVVNDDLSAESVRLQSRPFWRTSVHTEEELEAVLQVSEGVPDAMPGYETLPDVIKKPVVRIEFNVQLPFILKRLKEAFAPRCHLMLLPMTITKNRESTPAIPATTSTLAVEIQAALAAEDASLLLQLLESRDTRAAKEALSNARIRHFSTGPS